MLIILSELEESDLISGTYLWQIQVVVFGSVAIQCFSFAVTSELGFVFYGLSAFVMWMRTLHFILVQQDLGQVMHLMYKQRA